MTKLTTEITIEELQYRIHAHENDLTQMWTADYFLSVQKELLALKQATKNPVAWDYEWASYITCEGPQDFNRIIEREAPPNWAIDEGQARNIIPLYAAPVLLKQQSIKLPSTRMWAGVIECYGKNEIIAAIKSAGYEVSND